MKFNTLPCTYRPDPLTTLPIAIEAYRRDCDLGPGELKILFSESLWHELVFVKWNCRIEVDSDGRYLMLIPTLGIAAYLDDSGRLPANTFIAF